MTETDTHREQLSALIDGALDADQSRFLLRRLQHDGALADDLACWQMTGDVLRGQASAPAPMGFAEAVGMRVATEPHPLIEEVLPAVVPAATMHERAVGSASRAVRWGWFGGGALAASLAMAMVWTLRPSIAPIDGDGGSLADIEASAAPSPAIAATSIGVGVQPAGSAADDNPALGNVMAAASTAVAAAAVARTPVARRGTTTATRVARAAAAPANATTPTAPVREAAPALRIDESATARTVASSDDAATSTRDPFQAPTARPWPRAVVPASGSATFNASLDRGAAFRPFAAGPLQGADEGE